MRKWKTIVCALILTLTGAAAAGCAGEPAALAGMTLAKTATALYVGESETLLVNFYPADAADRRIFWSAENDRIATVDAGGTLRARAAGTTTVYAESYDGGYRVGCTVRVYDPVVAAEGIRILVNGAAQTALTTAMNDTEPLIVTAEVLPNDVSNGNYTLTVADETVVRLAPDGALTRVGVGQTTIAAVSADGAFRAELAVTTTPATTRTFSLGRSAVLGATGLKPVKLTPVFSSPFIADKDVVYRSDDPAIAAVSAAGEISFVAEGETTIHAVHTASGLTAATRVKVVAPTVIRTAQELQNLDNVENAADTLYVLGNDIDLGTIANFNPIGYDGGEESPADSRKFQSTLDGNGYTIRGLTIDRHSSSGDWDLRDLYNAGLFVYVGARGNVRNLTVADATVYARITGIVAGCNEGVIENCLLTDVRLDSTTSYNGLIAGTVAQSGTIANCVVAGTIAESSTNRVIAGRNYGYIENVTVERDRIPASVRDAGMTIAVIDTAYTYRCRLLATAAMLDDPYEGLPDSVWIIEAGRLPALRRPV